MRENLLKTWQSIYDPNPPYIIIIIIIIIIIKKPLPFIFYLCLEDKRSKGNEKGSSSPKSQLFQKPPPQLVICTKASLFSCILLLHQKQKVGNHLLLNYMHFFNSDLYPFSFLYFLFHIFFIILIRFHSTLSNTTVL